MELELAITSYQRLSPTVIASKRFNAAIRHVLGRSRDCDWHLPDPDRVVSSRHAEISFRDGHFWLKDTSTNGVYINGASEPVGEGQEAPLANADCLRFGDYEVVVQLIGPVAAAAPVDISVGMLPACPPARPGAPATAELGSNPVHESVGGNPTLASGLSEQRLDDSHVEIPDTLIPPVWKWGEKPGTPSAKSATPEFAASEPGQLKALFEGLGMPYLANQTLPPEFLQGLGGLTRILLDRLLDLLHARAEQKQKLRVQKTLFQRSENNPLKFSATAQDAIEALFVRRHNAFLGPQDAVEAAFKDVLQHERALMAGVEGVIAQLLGDDGTPTEAAGLGTFALVRKARAYDAWLKRRAHYVDEFGDGDRMLRSDAFIDAYETAISESERG